MNLTTYIKTPEGIRETADAGILRGSKHILQAVTILRDQRRVAVEGDGIKKPKAKVRPEKIEDDIVFELGVIWACNWVLGLPDMARKSLERES